MLLLLPMSSTQHLKPSASSYLHPDYRPYPIRLGELKPALQSAAYENDKSLHWLIKKILAAYGTLSTEEKDAFLARALTKRAF